MTDTTQATQVTTIVVDGVEYTAPLGGRLFDFLHEIGKDIPHFCYHPGLSVAASCRQCQVESKGKGPRPGCIVSCRERIVEGMEILTESEAAKTARRGVMEFLLMNHPLDCPICDKAGECMLQDTAYETGQNEGRSHEPRRHLPKRKSLGDTILLDNERCILCTRCVRFFEEVTGDSQLTVADRGDRSVLTTFFDEPLTGDYQGNIVDLCPVGALTLKKFRFESRVWFLEETKAVCGMCSRGCNTIVETRDGNVLRIRPRHEPEVNGYWMCDHGRLDFDLFNLTENEGRLLEHAHDDQGRLVACTRDEALTTLASCIALDESPIAALLSPWATNEEGQAFLDAWTAIAELMSHEVRFGFLDPVGSGTEDELLRTSEAAPNARGLAELGLERIPPKAFLSGLAEHKNVLLFGFGLDELLPDVCKVALKAATNFFFHGFNLGHFHFVKVALPALSPLEKSGYWTNIDGRRQYTRAALRGPAGVTPDAELFTEIAKQVANAHAVMSTAGSTAQPGVAQPAGGEA